MALASDAYATIRVQPSPRIHDALTGRFTQGDREELLLIYGDRIVLFDTQETEAGLRQLVTQDLTVIPRAATVLSRHADHGGDVVVLVTSDEDMLLLACEGDRFVVRVTSVVEKDRKLHTSRLSAAQDGSAICRNTYEGVRTIYVLCDSTICDLDQRVREPQTPMSASCFVSSEGGESETVLVTHAPCAATSGSIELASWRDGDLQMLDRHVCPTSSELCQAREVLDLAGKVLLVGERSYTVLHVRQIGSGDVAGTHTKPFPQAWASVSAVDCAGDVVVVAEGTSLRLMRLDGDTLSRGPKFDLGFLATVVRVLSNGRTFFAADDLGQSVILNLTGESEQSLVEVGAITAPGLVLDMQRHGSEIYLTGGGLDTGHLTSLQFGYQARSSTVDLGESVDAADRLFVVILDTCAYILVNFPWQSLLLACTTSQEDGLELNNVGPAIGIRQNEATTYFGRLGDVCVQVCRRVVVLITSTGTVTTTDVDDEILVATGSRELLVLAVRRQGSFQIDSYELMKQENGALALNLVVGMSCAQEPTALAMNRDYLAVATATTITAWRFQDRQWLAVGLNYSDGYGIDSDTFTQRLALSPFRSIVLYSDGDYVLVVAARQDGTVVEAGTGEVSSRSHSAVSYVSDMTNTSDTIATITRDCQVHILRTGDSTHGHLPVVGTVLRARGGVLTRSPFNLAVTSTGLLTWYGTTLTFTEVALTPSYTHVEVSLTGRGRRLLIDERARLAYVGLDDGERADLVAYDLSTLQSVSAQPTQYRKRKNADGSRPTPTPLFKTGETIYALASWTITVGGDVVRCLVICLATPALANTERGGKLLIIQPKRDDEQQVRYTKLLSRRFDEPVLAAIASDDPSSGQQTLLVGCGCRLEQLIFDTSTRKLRSGGTSPAPFRSAVIELRPGPTTETVLVLTQLDGPHVVRLADLYTTHKSLHKRLNTACVSIGGYDLLRADKFRNVWLERLADASPPRAIAKLPSVVTRMVMVDEDKGVVACCCLDGSVHLLVPLAGRSQELQAWNSCAPHDRRLPVLAPEQAVNARLRSLLQLEGLVRGAGI